MVSDMRQSPCPVVYVGGFKEYPNKRAWYRVDVEFLQKMMTEVQGNGHVVDERNKRKKRKVLVQSSMRNRPMYRWKLVKKAKKIRRVKLNAAAAELKSDSTGGGTIMGDHIYWFGDFSPRRCSCTSKLVRRYINNKKPSKWKTLSSSEGGSSCYFFVAPVGDKLYILRGTVDKSNELDRNSRHELSLCGKIYNPDSRSWENLNCTTTINTYNFCYLAPFAALVEDQDGEPIEFLFYSLLRGSIMYFNLATGELRNDENHSSLALWKRPHYGRPLGLERCNDFENLIQSTQGPAMFSNNTLYWFTGDLYLYAYDIRLRRWIQSPFLGKQFPTLKPVASAYKEDLCENPVLVDLRNGKYLVIVPELPGQLTVAPITIDKRENFLSVSVESFHPLSLDDTSFELSAQLSMLKNTRSSTIREPVRSTRGS